MVVWLYGCMAKLTFSLDAETAAMLRKMATRLRKPQSLIVREAIARYGAEEDKLAPASMPTPCVDCHSTLPLIEVFPAGCR